MADDSRSSTSHLFYSIFCLGSLCKGCKSFVFNCYQEKSPSLKKHDANKKRIKKAFTDEIKKSKKEEARARSSQDLRCNSNIDELERRVLKQQKNIYHDKSFTFSPEASPSVSRSGNFSNLSNWPKTNDAAASLRQSVSTKNSSSGEAAFRHTLSRTASCRRSSA